MALLLPPPALGFILLLPAAPPPPSLRLLGVLLQTLLLLLLLLLLLRRPVRSCWLLAGFHLVGQRCVRCQPWRSEAAGAATQRAPRTNALKDTASRRGPPMAMLPGL